MARRKYRGVSVEKLLEFSVSKRRDFAKADVVLFHCYLDNLLEGLLRRAFIRHRAVAEMFEPGRALWSFTTKVAVAFAMGLIADYERDDLLLVNKARNRVAHNIRGTTFRDRNMRQWTSQMFWVEVLRSHNRKDPRNAKLLSNPRAAFNLAASALGRDIEGRWNVRRLRPVTTLPRGWRKVEWPRTVAPR